MKDSKRKTAQSGVTMTKRAWEQKLWEDGVYESIVGHTPEGYRIGMYFSERYGDHGEWVVCVLVNDASNELVMQEKFDTEDEAFAIVEGLESGEIGYTPPTPGKWGSRKVAYEENVGEIVAYDGSVLCDDAVCSLLSVWRNNDPDNGYMGELPLYVIRSCGNDEMVGKYVVLDLNDMMSDEPFDTEEDAEAFLAGIGMHEWEHVASHKVAQSDDMHDTADAVMDAMISMHGYLYDDDASTPNQIDLKDCAAKIMEMAHGIIDGDGPDGDELVSEVRNMSSLLRILSENAEAAADMFDEVIA